MTAFDGIIIIGAGGIVQHAHLPAYSKYGLPVKGIYDQDAAKAEKLADIFRIPALYKNLDETILAVTPLTIVDIALPASAFLGVLEQLPDGSTVLLQKPMGENLEQATAILNCCRRKQLNAAVNFQLRYAPYILEAKKILSTGKLGTITEVDININVLTPWELWHFLYDLPRMDILYHSIHYVDLVRHLFGQPAALIARTHKHPGMPRLASVKSLIQLDYGPELRANILTNHSHKFGSRHQHAWIRIEGTEGALFIQPGLLLDYPNGGSDKCEYIITDAAGNGEWQEIPLNGSWFPDAFAGSMQELIRTLTEPGYSADNRAEDAYQTMVLVEKAYENQG